jgi:peptide/nickel transport system permease protein
MTRHIIRRLIQSIPTIFGITILSFILMVAAAGDPIGLLTFDPDMPAEVRNQMREELGLNDPYPVQYLAWMFGNDWMWWKDAAWRQRYIDRGTPEEEIPTREVTYGIMRGDFGSSFKYKRDVLTMIWERVPATAELGIASLVVGIILGIPLGIFAAIWRGSFFDNFTRIMAVIGNALPSFWLGLMLLLLVGVMLDDYQIPGTNIVLQTDWGRGNRCDLSTNSRRVDQFGNRGCGAVPIYERLEYLILPTIVLSYGFIAGYSRFMRTAMLDTISSDYIRTARAKGLPNSTVWFKHAARNSLIPIATFLGPAIVGVLSGAVITEAIFSWPGLGRLFIEGITGQDYPLVMASVIIGALSTVVAFIISDVLYAVFDPRIRF